MKDNYSSNHIIQHGWYHLILHDTLALNVEFNDGVIQSINPEIGFLHTATEKLVETKPFNQNICYMDRLDYSATLCNEHAYVLAIEKLLQITPPIRAQYIRVMFDELTRISSHLLWLAQQATYLGIINLPCYCLAERENILDCYEAVSGNRVNPNYYRPGGVIRDLPHKMPKYKLSEKNKPQLDKLNNSRTGSLLDFIWHFTERFPSCIDEYENLLTDNTIWQKRTVNVGVISSEQAIALGFSGPMLRATGIAWDLRKKQAYEIYDQLSFNLPVGKNGDCYDRYLVRMAEMRESTKIIRQAVVWLKNHLGPVMLDNYKISPPKASAFKHDIESLIHHFKLFSEGYCVPQGDCYAAIEHPKGEFGVYLISDGANKPYRVKIRTASFAHLSAISIMAKGHTLEDLVTIMGAQDIVIREVDR